MLVDVAARKDGVYHYLFRFDSEQNPQTTDSDLPLRTPVNKMI